MLPILHTILLVAFAGLLLWAAYTDVRRFEIPNAIPLLLLAFYPVLALTTSGPTDIVPTVLVAFVAFAIGVAMFAAGLIGGGDVKLFAAACLWIGPGKALDFVTLTALAGGIFGIVLLTGPGRIVFDRLSVATAIEPGPDDGPVSVSRFRRPMPYGVAITIAAIALLHPFNLA